MPPPAIQGRRRAPPGRRAGGQVFRWRMETSFAGVLAMQRARPGASGKRHFLRQVPLENCAPASLPRRMGATACPRHPPLGSLEAGCSKAAWSWYSPICRGRRAWREIFVWFLIIPETERVNAPLIINASLSVSSSTRILGSPPDVSLRSLLSFFVFLYLSVCEALKLRSLPFTHPIYVASRYFQ